MLYCSFSSLGHSGFSKKGWQTPNEGTNSYLATRWHCWWRRGRDGGGGEIGSNLFRDFFFFFLRVCFKEKKKGKEEERGEERNSPCCCYSPSLTPEGWRGEESFRQSLVTTAPSTVGCGGWSYVTPNKKDHERQVQ